MKIDKSRNGGMFWVQEYQRHQKPEASVLAVIIIN